MYYLRANWKRQASTTKQITSIIKYMARLIDFKFKAFLQPETYNKARYAVRLAKLRKARSTMRYERNKDALEFGHVIKQLPKWEMHVNLQADKKRLAELNAKLKEDVASLPHIQDLYIARYETPIRIEKYRNEIAILEPRIENARMALEPKYRAAKEAELKATFAAQKKEVDNDKDSVWTVESTASDDTLVNEKLDEVNGEQPDRKTPGSKDQGPRPKGPALPEPNTKARPGVVPETGAGTGTGVRPQVPETPDTHTPTIPRPAVDGRP